MGCDIHSKIEVREYSVKDRVLQPWKALPVYTMDDGVLNLADHYSGRDYELFGWLTGGRVRCDVVTPLPTPRGVPSNISDELKEKFDSYDDCDGYHSASYLTLEELESAYRKIPKKIYCDYDGQKVKNPFRKRVRWFIDSIRVFTDSCGYYSDDDVRIVFCFDS